MSYPDYQPRRPRQPGPFARMRFWSVTTWLIAINVAIFVLDSLTGHLLINLGYFSALTAVYGMQVWRFITFQFLHASIEHIFFNMLTLYFFGPLIEGYLGARRYLAFYLLCGASGAAMYMLLMYVGVLPDGPNTPLVGASAGIYGVLIAAARVAPNATVMLLFPPIPLRLRTLAWIFIGIAVFTIVQQGHNAGGQAAHLGGAALGFLLISKPQVLNVFDHAFARRRSKWR